jgi:pimeloyl-ACP methyl ester carboxylesterase
MLSTMAITGPFNLEYSMALWRRIACPTLLVHGAESGEFWRGKPGLPYLDADDLARRRACFRDHQFVEIPGAGHMVHFDRPEELLSAVRAFLAAPRS